jgi:hypothetical protein
MSAKWSVQTWCPSPRLPQRAKLSPAPLQGLGRDGRGVGPGRGAPLLAAVQVGGHPVPGLHHRRRPSDENLIEQPLPRHCPLAQPTGNAGVQFGHDGGLLPSEVGLTQGRRQEAHPTADVETHPAGGNHPVSLHVGGGHPADGKAVAPVDVGHGEGSLHDPRQVGHVGHLLQGAIGLGPGEEARRCEYAAGDPHAAFRPQLPGHLPGPRELHADTVRRAGRTRKRRGQEMLRSRKPPTRRATSSGASTVIA